MLQPRDGPELSWNQFWGEISSRLGALDLTSRNSTKFDALSEWIGHHLGLRSGAVVCKFVQHSKNRWNRLREALRRRPTAIFLFLEGGEPHDSIGRVREAANVCPDLEFVIVALRHAGGAWVPSQLLYRTGSTLPRPLAESRIDRVEFEPGSTVAPASAPNSLAGADRVELCWLLYSLGAELGSDSSPNRPRLLDLLAIHSGFPVPQIIIKAIPSSKNLGNRLGEALARNPAMLIVVCPEMLGHRAAEEAGRWPAAISVTLVTVLCGEELDVLVQGPDRDLVRTLRGLFDSSNHLQAGPLSRPMEIGDSSTGVPQPWTGWTYEEWNRVLVHHVFDDSEGDAPVERLVATPEVLREVVGESSEATSEVVRAFVSTCVDNMPSGRSFCGFCRDSGAGRAPGTHLWSVESDSPPHFFGMLWFTCLVAYGHPESAGGFFDRFWGLVGKTDHIKCLPDLWHGLQAWTETKRQRSGGIRELILPPEDDFRTTIGFSHYLAFPHALDRRVIASVLEDAELVGFEPPITPVVKALLANRDRFSTLFREDLDNFVGKFIEGALEEEKSAFWRAVRQEALEPSSRGMRRGRRNRTTLLAFFDDDGLQLLLGCTEDWSAPPGVRKVRLDNPIGGFEFYAQEDGAGLEGIVKSMLQSILMLGPGPRALVKQGVLIFQEDQSQEYYLVSGHEINGADVVLVRNDLACAFTATFGGRMHDFRLEGWSEITGCNVKPLDELPDGLDRVLQLLRTMSPPSLRLVGGIKISDGYMGFRGFLPSIRAPGAVEVTAEVGGDTFVCELSEHEWVMPEQIVESLPVTVRLQATWEGSRSPRSSDRIVRFTTSPIFEEYKTLGMGHFFIESCRPGQLEVEGGSSIPLRITSEIRGTSHDLIEWEPSARYLGPGVGEMSVSPAVGFDWLAIGPKNRPELLLFVGNPKVPTHPEDRISPNKGDRRHWKSAFSKARTVLVRDEEGQFRDIDDSPLVKEAFTAFHSHRPTETAERCVPTNLNTLTHEPPSRTATVARTRAFEDAIAALASRRSGLRYRTVQSLLSILTGTKDHSLHHELIRAWAETGAIDIVRHQAYSLTLIVARSPRFVAVRRGPSIEASLIGLTTSDLVARIRARAQELDLDILELRPGNPWQAPILRLRGAFDAVERITTGLGLAPGEWLEWEGAMLVPANLDVNVTRQELWRDSPPKGFVPKKTWSFEESMFLRGVRDDAAEVGVQQWVHPEQCSIYVVLIDGKPDLWTYIRNWALLHAYDVAGRAPFVLDRAGWIRAEGRTPVHLPLALGRLCTIVGEGVPGPTMQGPGVTVGGYCYPFGRRATEFVETVIPAGWLKDVEG